MEHVGKNCPIPCGLLRKFYCLQLQELKVEVRKQSQQLIADNFFSGIMATRVVSWLPLNFGSVLQMPVVYLNNLEI
jgi:hypothetical protein